MKHAGKRFAAVLMVVVMALSLLPVAALATQETVDLTSGLVGYWTFDGDTEQEKLSSKTTGGPAATLASGVSLVNSDLNAEAGGGVQFNGASNGYLKLELAGEHALSAEKAFPLVRGSSIPTGRIPTQAPSRSPACFIGRRPGHSRLSTQRGGRRTVQLLSGRRKQI